MNKTITDKDNWRETLWNRYEQSPSGSVLTALDPNIYHTNLHQNHRMFWHQVAHQSSFLGIPSFLGMPDTKDDNIFGIANLV